jgi:hypothetical protein
MGSQEGHLIVDGGEVDFHPHRLEVAYGTKILKSDDERELMGWTTYAASWGKVLQLVLLVPSITWEGHDEWLY